VSDDWASAVSGASAPTAITALRKNRCIREPLPERTGGSVRQHWRRHGCNCAPFKGHFAHSGESGVIRLVSKQGRLPAPAAITGRTAHEL
jgi:hypothetical protein